MNECDLPAHGSHGGGHGFGGGGDGGGGQPHFSLICGL